MILVCEKKKVNNPNPSPNLIITLENWGYMATLKEKLREIKGFYRKPKPLPALAIT